MFAAVDDVVQEVCVEVVGALPSYRVEDLPFPVFVDRIAKLRMFRALRSKARNRVEPVPEIPDSPDLAAGPEQRVIQGELAEQMNKLLATLPNKQRDILVLRVVMGLSAEETAEAVGSTPVAVRTAQHRALARLRSVLESEEL